MTKLARATTARNFMRIFEAQLGYIVADVAAAVVAAQRIVDRVIDSVLGAKLPAVRAKVAQCRQMGNYFTHRLNMKLRVKQADEFQGV